MLKIRNSIFETNSSSTHTITYISSKSDDNEIPRNLKEYIITDNIRLPYNGLVNTETKKVRYFLGLLAGNMKELGISYIWESPDEFKDGEFEKFCEKVRNLPAIQGYIQSIKELYNTEVILDFANTAEFPYFSECVSSEDFCLSYLTLKDGSSLDIESSSSVCEFLKDFIKDPGCYFLDDEETW